MWRDNTTSAVLYPTEVKTTILSIDSAFRDSPEVTSSTDFSIRLPRTFKNVIAARLSSIEIPNTWYAFTSARGETSMLFEGNYVSIEDGNYTPDELVDAVQFAISSASISPNVTVTLPPTSNRVVIDNSGLPFTMEFGSSYSCEDASTGVVRGATNPHNNGLGYLLGFTAMAYTGASTYTAEYVVNTLRDNYIFLQLPDIESSVESYSYNSSSIKAFAKIIVTVDKNVLVYDNGGNMLTKQTQFAQPINISSFRVKLVDALGIPLDLHADFSFTLEIQEVVSSKVYEAYRNNLISNDFS